MKRCPDCGETKPLTQYWRNATRKDGKQSICIGCSLRRNTAWAKANPELRRRTDRKRTAANPERRRVSSAHGKRKLQDNNYAKLREMFGPNCEDCGQEHPMEIFNYHHTDPKTKVGKLRVYSWGWERVKAYVSTGVVQLCPTCHRIRHVVGPRKPVTKVVQWQRNARAKTYARLTDMFGVSCADCQKGFPIQVFDYHHLDPADKDGKLCLSWRWERVRSYVEHKTVQLCPTCHQLRHYAEHQARRTK